jgi:IclR family KDG regulon transcriptional repressor
MIEQDNMKVLTKTFDILDQYLRGDEELAVTDLSEKLGLNKTTVSRIMARLEKRGYLRQIGVRGKYSLGAIFLEFSGIIKKRLKIREIAIPHLFELSRSVGESTILGVWDGRGYSITESFHDTAQQSNPLKVVPDEGISMPLFCTCLGKIFLAGMSESDLRTYLISVKLEPRTSRTLTDATQLARELSRIKQDGLAYDDEEFAVGVRGVATGIFNIDGKTVGSIGVLAPSPRMSLVRLQEIGPLVKDYALEISRQLGYPKP